MADQLVSIGFGKGTFKSRSFSLSGFVLTPGFIRTTPNKVFKKQGSTQRFPVTAHPEVNGYLYLDSVEATDGAVILVQCSQRTGASPIADAAVFIALRTTGPMLSIQAILPSSPDSTVGNHFLVFQGRGDILKPEELAAFGITPERNWLRGFTDNDEVDECYVISEVSPGSTPRRKADLVVTDSGEKVAVPRPAGRRVRLR